MTALVGYRAWNVTPDGALLSLNLDGEPWPAKSKKMAACALMRNTDDYTWGYSSYATTSAYIPPPPLVTSFEALFAKRKAKRDRDKFAKDHHPPHEGCSCGIYAAKSNRGHHYTGYAEGAPVWGEVFLWGKIQEYTEGYRAEFAYPKRLSTSSGLADRIASRYGVECEDVSDSLLVSQVSAAAALVPVASMWGSLKAALRW